MKARLRFIFLTLIFVSSLLLFNTAAQDYTQWELPDGAIARIGKGEIRGIQYAPDGTLLAVASNIGIWYDTATLQEAALFTADIDGVSCMALSPDGRTFAIGSDNDIHLLDRVTGTLKTTLIGHTEGIFSIAFSPDGKTSASASGDSTIGLWDINTGEHKYTLTGHTRYIDSVAFNPDGNTIATGHYLGAIRLWDAHTRKHKNTFAEDIWGAWSVAFSSDGRILASGSADCTVLLWKLH